jgi:hypothetical protein
MKAASIVLVVGLFAVAASAHNKTHHGGGFYHGGRWHSTHHGGGYYRHRVKPPQYQEDQQFLNQ